MNGLQIRNNKTKSLKKRGRKIVKLITESKNENWMTEKNKQI